MPFRKRVSPIAGQGLMCLLSGTWLCAGMAYAADPMRPLPQMQSSAPAAGTSSGGPSNAPASTSGSPPSSVPPLAGAGTGGSSGSNNSGLPTLVAIRQDTQGRWQALFGERWLAVGERLGTHTVAAIGPNTVDLLQGKARSSVSLLPSFAPMPLAANERPNQASALTAKNHLRDGKP